MSTIYWCRGCGFEDTQALGACGSCGQALAHSEVQWLEDGAAGEETVYEVDITSLQRAGLVEALIVDGVTHRWDSVSELVVPTSEEEAVDVIFDDVLHEELEVVGEDGEALAVVDGDEEDDDDERDDDGEPDEGYQTMSQLFFSADRLLKKWEGGDVGSYIADATALLMSEAPIGVEDEPWAELQSLARNTSLALQDDAEADVEPDVARLRDELKTLI